MDKNLTAPSPDGRFPKSDYEKRVPILEALREEAAFIIGDDISEKEIKIHTIESRVKEYESWKTKISERLLSEDCGVDDAVGVRIVCLFKSDIHVVDKRIYELFDVLKKDDKVSSTDDSFGYMSIHYICKMKNSYKGPRYNKIRDIRFEIQLRTLCMHAWAAISHYLDYKSEWDIPDHLRKGLNALSGLFYVADEQYERLYDARQESKLQTTQEASHSNTEQLSINLDTVSAYVSSRFPDRRVGDAASISGLIQELNEAGYTTIGEMDRDVLKGMDAMLDDEKAVIKRQKETRNPFFTRVGATRGALKAANPKFMVK